MKMSTRTTSIIASAVFLTILLSGCSRHDGTLDTLDKELRALSASLSPSIVDILPVGDNGEPTTQVGSAVVIDQQGELLTTASLLKDGKPLVARLTDGRLVPVTLVGTDWETNLAVLRLEQGSNLPAIPLLGRSSIAVGQLGILVGSAPMVRGPFVTFGVMSNTYLGGDDPYGAPLYALMSMSILARPGAPIFDVSGQLLGMVDGKMIDINGGCWSVIPLKSIKKIIGLLRQGGGVPRGYLGIVPATVKSTEATKGVLVSEVLPDSPAQKAGIAVGDIIAEVNDIYTQQVSTLRIHIAESPNKSVKLDLIRGGKRIILTITPSSHIITANDATRNPLRKL